MSKTAFISGHLDLTYQEFVDHYRPKIRAAIEEKDRFVVGDAPGCDTLAQDYLQSKICYTFADVFHMLESPRYNSGSHIAYRGFWTYGGYKSDEERDAAMTESSDYDITWVRPGREKSGTQANIDRRKQKIKRREKP